MKCPKCNGRSKNYKHLIDERKKYIEQVANLYKIKLHLKCDDEPKNHASSAGNEIFLGEFNDVDILTIAFFHELAHCLSIKVLPHRKYCSSIVADEGFAWEYGFELAAQYGFTWRLKHKVYRYAEQNLRSYFYSEKINQTQEEWFCGLQTKEKAKVLEMMCYKEQFNDGESMSGLCEEHDTKYWEKWLKEKHHE